MVVVTKIGDLRQALQDPRNTVESGRRYSEYNQISLRSERVCRRKCRSGFAKWDFCISRSSMWEWEEEPRGSGSSYLEQYQVLE
jgi:hypothetical protein